jgi:hypothetical protein
MDQSDIRKESETRHDRKDSGIATRHNHASERHASRASKKIAHREEDHNDRKEGATAVKKIRRTAIGLLIALTALGITPGARAAKIDNNRIDIRGLSRGIICRDIRTIRTRLIGKAIVDANRIEIARIIRIDSDRISRISV